MIEDVREYARPGRDAPAWWSAWPWRHLAAPTWGRGAASLVDYALVAPGGQPPAPLAVGAAEALAVLAVGVPLARRAVNALRRLPQLPAVPTAPAPPAR
ncbi:MAG TPA: hypothetical protein VHM23_16895 [Actinomycetota bacterium]|jgi:hypothetical protein|nr:hypothetical protein [Actinomycetota bacterium]